MNKTQAKQVEKLLSTIDIDIWSVLAVIETAEQLEEHLSENGYFNVEIIYHQTAMEYLMEHDTSLAYSMELASIMGLEVRDLNSETLASLLATDQMGNDFSKIMPELETILGED